MNTIEEQSLRQRLGDDLATLAPGPAPVGAVVRRGAARRARRRAAAAAGIAAGLAAAVTAILLVPSPGPATRPAPAAHVTRGTQPGPRPATARPVPSASGAVFAPGTVFASGTAGGAAWRLSAGNVAGPGAPCLPALMLNGTDAGLLPDGPGTPGAIGGLAYLSAVPGQPGAGYAVLRVAPSVTRLAARLAGGTELSVRPAAVTACGQRWRLAGFRYPLPGVTTITAYAGTQAVSRLRPVGGLARAPAAGPLPAGAGPAGRLLRPAAGVWQYLWHTDIPVRQGPIGSGRSGGTAWRVSVLLGVDGECFTAAVSGGRASGASCGPITPPPATVVPRLVPLPPGTGLAVYAALLPPGTVRLAGTLAGGGTVRATVTTVAGRRYAALAVPAGQPLARLTAFGAAGQPLGTARP